MLEQVSLLTTEYDMLPAGGLVLCAVSGGSDSMCLLHYLWTHRAQGGYSLAAAHFDHNLRGGESRRDAQFVADWCREQGIPCHLGSGDVRAEAGARGLGVEETARAMRYDFLRATAQAVGADRTATAHNADDNAETLLLHLVRGSGLQGLTGIPPRRDDLVRPLLTTPRAEIEAYLEEYGVPHVEDSTNADTQYARNRLRHQVMPVLRELNPRLIESLNTAVANLRGDNDYLNARAAMAASAARWAEDDLVIRAELVAGEPDPIAVRMVRWMFAQMGETQFRSAHLKSVVELARGEDPSAVVFLPHGMMAQRIYEELLLTASAQALPPFRPVALAPDGTTAVADIGWTFTCRPAVCPDQPPADAGHFFLSRAKVRGDITVRPREAGDEVALPRRDNKSVKKLFIDSKVPRRDRGRVPLLADGDRRVLYVGGFGPDAPHLAAPGEDAWEITADRDGRAPL